MPCCLRGAVSVGLSVAIAWLTLPSASRGEVVWSGLTFNFDHPGNSAVQDQISPNVALTRDSAFGIYNAAYESAYEFDLSPEWTLWATKINNPGADVSATNFAELNYADWRTAYGGPPALAENIVGTKAVLYLPLDEIYLDVQFTNWGQGMGNGGAFSYLRAQPIPEPAAGSLAAIALLAFGSGRRRRIEP